MMSGFEDFGTAMRFRDVLRTAVRNVLDIERPPYQYATVASIDRTNRKATVKFAGEETAVTVYMGSVQPNSIGQTVRINGLRGDRFIEEVMGLSYVEHSHDYSGTFAAKHIGVPSTLAEFQRRLFTQRGQTMATGADTRIVTDLKVRWTSRILPIGFGWGEWGSPHFDIAMPAVGYQVPHYPNNYGWAGGVTSPTTIATTGDGFHLDNWASLWYKLPFTGGHVDVWPSQPGNFFSMDYQAKFHPSPESICIAVRNGDSRQVQWFDGQVTDYWRNLNFINGAAQYPDMTFGACALRKDNGLVTFKGLAQGPGNVAWFGPFGGAHRPRVQHIYQGAADSGATWEARMLPDGYLYNASGAKGYASLANIAFMAESG